MDLDESELLEVAELLDVDELFFVVDKPPNRPHPDRTGTWVLDELLEEPVLLLLSEDRRPV